MSEFRVNSFQIPNVLVDEIMQEISGNALKCLLLIVRQTRGWHKTTDKISASFFEEKCGLSKNTVLSSINELLEVGLIKKEISNHQNGLNEYSLTNEFDMKRGAKIEPVQNLNGSEFDSSSAKFAPPRAKFEPQAVQILHPQNTYKDKKQKTNTKNNTTSKNNVDEFDFFSELLNHGVDEENATAWLKVRKLKKAVNTKIALDLLLSESRKAGYTVDEAVKTAAGNSWAGFKAEWVQKRANATSSEPSSTARAIMALENMKSAEEVTIEQIKLA